MALTTYVIYKIYWPLKGIFYIGKTKGFRKRRNRHLREMGDGSHHNKKLVHYRQKYGEPKIKIIASAACDVTLAELERSFLDKYKSHRKCCNIYHK